MSTERLAEITRLEFHGLDLLAQPMTAERRTTLNGLMSRLRVAKARLLAANPDTLRKAAALDPDSLVGHDKGPVYFRAPASLVGMTVHTVSGAIAVPPSGIVETHRDHAELHADLAGRGFRRMRNLDVGKAASADIVGQFRTSRLQRLTTLPFAGARL